MKAQGSVKATVQPSPVLSVDAKSLATESAAMHFGDYCREDAAHYTSDSKAISDCSKAIAATRAIEVQSQKSGASQADLDSTSIMIGMELFTRAGAYIHRGDSSAAKVDLDESEGRAQAVLKNRTLAPSDLQAAQVLSRTVAEMTQALSEQQR